MVQWLDAGGSPDAVCPAPTGGGEAVGFSLLHATATVDQLEITKELLHRGASVDLPTTLGLTALMAAAQNGHLSTLLLLLQHGANPNFENIYGGTPLMSAAYQGHEACVQALLRAGSNTELVDSNDKNALQWAEAQGHVAITKLLRQHARSAHASCISLGVGGVDLCAAAPLAWQWAMLCVLLLVANCAILAPEAEAQARSNKKPKKKNKAGRAGAAAAAGNEPTNEAPPTAEPAPPPASVLMTAVSAAERRESALRAAVAGDGLGAEAHAQCNKIQAQPDEAEHEAKQVVAVQAARLAAAERAREVAEKQARQVGELAPAASKARDEPAAAATAEATAAATTAATNMADALERAMAERGERGSSGAARPSSEASEAAEVPEGFVCSITAEIMTDPVTTVDGFTYERAAITEWLRSKDTSPFTGATLESKALIPNLALRSMIRSFVEARSRPGACALNY